MLSPCGDQLPEIGWQGEPASFGPGHEPVPGGSPVPAPCCLEGMSPPSGVTCRVRCSQVIPEGAGPVKPSRLVGRGSLLFSARCWARWVEAAGQGATAGRLPGRGRPDADAARCGLVAAEKTLVEFPGWCSSWSCRYPEPVSRPGQTHLGLPVIPSPGKAWSGSTQTVAQLVGVNQMGRPRHRRWGS